MLLGEVNHQIAYYTSIQNKSEDEHYFRKTFFQVNIVSKKKKVPYSKSNFYIQRLSMLFPGVQIQQLQKEFWGSYKTCKKGHK